MFFTSVILFLASFTTSSNRLDEKVWFSNISMTFIEASTWARCALFWNKTPGIVLNWFLETPTLCKEIEMVVMLRKRLINRSQEILKRKLPRDSVIGHLFYTPPLWSYLSKNTAYNEWPAHYQDFFQRNSSWTLCCVSYILYSRCMELLIKEMLLKKIGKPLWILSPNQSLSINSSKLE